MDKGIDAARIYGVDFSGASRAGKTIWITVGAARGGDLVIERCTRGADLPGSGSAREQVLPALRGLIAASGDAAWGLDFPFGLPRFLVHDASWKDFILAFPSRFPSANLFREYCRASAGGREYRRVTDTEAKTPFSPYNIRIFRQTYHGIRDILYPLVHSQSACVQPMERCRAGMPRIYEICPASTLKTHGLYLPYKGKAAENRLSREIIIAQLRGLFPIIIHSHLEWIAIGDTGGDALDSIIAAAAVHQAAVMTLSGAMCPVSDENLLEGKVYV